MVKSVVKSFLPKHTATEKRENTRKTEILRAFGGRLTRRSHAPKASGWPLPYIPIFSFFCQIRKWSNLWSKVFRRSTRRRKSEKTREKRRFCELSAVGSRGGHTLPKQAGDRYPTSRYSVFSVKSVSGQICGQKFFAEAHDGGKARKREKNGDFASFRRSTHETVTRSQTTRATNCATPRFITHLLYHTDHEMSTFFHSNIWKRAKNSTKTIFRFGAVVI